jgi:hypothetical protein
MLINGWNHYLWELPPGGEVSFRVNLTENYQRPPVPGERYQLTWPGGEIALWDWGTISEHLGNELKSQSAKESNLPKLVLPASTSAAFTARQESEPWPD